MNAHFFRFLSLFMLFCSLYVNGSNLSNDARDRGINETCSSYLSQIEKTYSLNGLNITSESSIIFTDFEKVGNVHNKTNTQIRKYFIY